ncbi:putative reverse transcriptase domain-containing protein [Tanacetum coccineum]
MAPKRTTRSTPVTPTPNATTTTTVTEAQLQALIDRGVSAAMAEAEASRVRNGYNSNDFSISNFTTSCQVKFATCTLLDDALTWWNAHVKTTTLEAAHAMPWATLKKMMTDKYCPRGEIKKIETEIWNLKASSRKPCKRLSSLQRKLRMRRPMPMAERQGKKKRKYDDLSKNNQNQQQHNKRQNTGQAYTAGNSDRKPYAGSKPLCSKCDYNHEGPCPPRCNNCKKVGHLAKDCRSRPANANNNNQQQQQ